MAELPTLHHEVRGPLPEVVKADAWQLYNLAEDPGERNDLSEQFPDKLLERVREWDDNAARNGVIIPDRSSGY